MSHHKKRVAVPLAVRTAVLALGPRDQACSIINISHGTWAELVDPNATLPMTTLARIQDKLERQGEMK
jgi:hypothetical protein